MTAEEKRSMQEMKDMIRELKQSNASYAEALSKRVDGLEATVVKKHIPFNLETSILSTVQSSFGEAISKSLLGYDSPLLKLIKEVVDDNSTELKAMISESFTNVIHTDEFKKSVTDAFIHKIGRILIDKSSGLLEKTVNDLRQDAVMKSRLSLAVDGVISDYLNNKDK